MSREQNNHDNFTMNYSDPQQQPQNASAAAAAAAVAVNAVGGFEVEEALFSTAPVGLHCVSSSGRILWANQTELNLLGFSKEEYVGQYVSSFVYSDQQPHSANNNLEQDGPLNLITADDKTLYKEILKRITGGNPIREIPVSFTTRSGTVVHLLLDCDGKGVIPPGATSFEYRYFRCFTRDDTQRRIQEMRSNVLFQETNRSLQMLDNFMNRSMSQMRLPLTLMEKACDLVTENIEDINEVVRRNASMQQAFAPDVNNLPTGTPRGSKYEAEEDGKPHAQPNFNNAIQNFSAPLTVAMSATQEARSVVGLASTLVQDALALVDDITDLCRFDQGQALMIDKEAVKVKDICLDAFQRLQIPLGSGGLVDIVLDIQERCPSRTMADRSVLKRSLALLLNFAVDAAANASSAADKEAGTPEKRGKVILSISEFQLQENRSACQIAVYYTNPPDASENIGMDFASGAHVETPATAFASASASERITRGNSYTNLPAIFQECYSKPLNEDVVALKSHLSGVGGSMMRRIRLRETIQSCMTTCRRDKLGLGLSLLYHLVGAQGSDLRYEIVPEGAPSASVKPRVMLPTMTKFWFILPMSLDFPDRLPAERILKDDLQTDSAQLSSAAPLVRSPFVTSSVASMFEDGTKQPRRKKRRTSNNESNLALFDASLLSAAAPVESSTTAQNDTSFTTAATTKKQYPGVAPGARPLVLVVEDTDVSASLICMHLRKLLCGSHRAENGEVAIEMLRSAPDVNMYSLILMDLRMPVMDGFEATKIIKRSWNIPVVALTGETSDEHQRRCDEIGFDDYTTKPLKRPQLKELLHKYIPGYQGPTL
jgi:CheY-like chemotaxis protein